MCSTPKGSLCCFYTQRVITPEESGWGRNHVMTTGQRMVQYLIFDKESLDVVCFEDGSIDTIYTSYE